MSFFNRIVSAVVFAALWTAVMLWWSFPNQGAAHIAILAGIGAMLGLFWYWLVGWFHRTNA